MTDTPIAPDDPRELLSVTRRLTRQVRRAQRGTWFPLLLFAALTLASVPVTLSSRHLDCRVNPPGRVCIAFSPGSYVYWPLALVLAYAAIAAFYVHRTRSRGVGTRVRPYVITGVIIAVVATAVSLWLVLHPGAIGYPFAPPSPGMTFLNRLVSPEGAIGLALLVLARVERNRALLGFGLVYLLIVIVGFWTLTPHSRWLFPVTTAAVLLLGSIGFALAERRAGRPVS
ncbi:MAG TPA: hypothetical protein VIX86_03255 [Streptosporangiaceae bacterium]